MSSRSPLVDVFGSFFPVWMLCIAIAIVLTLAVRFVLVRVHLDEELGARAVVYPSLVALLACTFWLVFFNN